METLVGIGMLVLWCGAGFIGDGIRFQKGYGGGTLAAILWGGPLYLLMSLVLPRRE